MLARPDPMAAALFTRRCFPLAYLLITPLPRDLPRPGLRRGAPTGSPGAGPALHAPGCAWHGRPFDSPGTMGAGTAPGASCGGGPHWPPTPRLIAGRPAPGSALGVPAPAIGR